MTSAYIRLDKVPEAIELRRVLEEAAARAAAPRAGAAGVARLREELARQTACETSVDHAGFDASDERFHELLSEIAGRARFWQVVPQTKTQVDRFRHLILPASGRMGSVVAEHGAIVDAVADADGAAEALSRHLDALLAALDGSRNVHPEMFGRQSCHSRQWDLTSSATMFGP